MQDISVFPTHTADIICHAYQAVPTGTSKGVLHT